MEISEPTHRKVFQMDCIKENNVTSRVLAALLIAFGIAAAGAGLHAQTSTATISGVTSDSQGGRVQRAKIMVTNLDTGVSTSVGSDADGVYAVSSLPIGEEVSRAIPPQAHWG